MLNGSLESFALADVLRFVASGGITGRVEIVREEVEGALALDQGRFVAAALADDEPPPTADEALDIAVLLFDGSGGTFEVIQEKWSGGPLDFDPDGLIKAVDDRREQWAAVVERLGSLDDPLALSPTLPDGTKDITLTADQWRLVALADGSRSAQDIARDAGMSVFPVANALADLAGSGVIAQGWSGDRDRTDEDPTEMLRELAATDDDGGNGDAEPVKEKKATVRPLKVPTREEQRVKLRR